MRLNDDINIRWLLRKDLHRVIAIEQWCFPHPWSEADFLHCLRQRNCIGMVAEMHGEIVGYVIYELHHKRLDILTLAVDPKYQRCGIATAMIAKLRSKLSAGLRSQILYKVSEWNDGGIEFLRAMGFEATAVIRDYFDTGETAYQFRLRHWAEEVKTVQTKEGVRWGR